MENNIFREMKKEKIKLIKEHAEYEKYNQLLKQTVQQLIQSNEKLLLSLKLRFDKFTQLNNQDFILNTSISDKIQQVNQKKIEMSEISEIEKKSIESSIYRSEKELNQIKADLKVAQSSDSNIFSEISDLQKKKESLLKEQKELKKSIEALQNQHNSDSSFSPFLRQYEQFHDNNESCMILKKQIFKIHQENCDKAKDSLHNKNTKFYLQPSKLLKVLSISQTPNSPLSSDDNNENSIKIFTEKENTAIPSNHNKNNENQNNDQIKDNIKTSKNNAQTRYSDSDINDINLPSRKNETKNDQANEFTVKNKRKVIKYQPSSKASTDNSKLNYKSKGNNNDTGYDSEMQSISFSDAQNYPLNDDKQNHSKKEISSKPASISKSTNNTSTNSIKIEGTNDSKPKNDYSLLPSKNGSVLTTNSEQTNQKSLPKLNIDLNSKNGNDKHILISPSNTGRKHDNSSKMLSPINISSKDKASTNRNSLINMFNNNNNNNNNTGPSTPRLGGIFKPSLTHQGSLITSQTTPSTPHKTKPNKILSSNEDTDIKNKLFRNNKEEAKENDNNKNNTNNDNGIDSRDNSAKTKNVNNKNINDNNNGPLSTILNQHTSKLIQNDEVPIEKEQNETVLVDNEEIVLEEEEEEVEIENTALFVDRKSQTKESFITQSKILAHSLHSLDQKLTTSNLELKITDLQQKSLDLETECFKINKKLMELNPGSRSFRRKNRPVLKYDLNINPLFLTDRNSGFYDVRNAETQSIEEIPDIQEIKNQIKRNSLNESQFMMNQHKQELMKLLSSFKIELKVEKMNASRKKVELNEELKRLKIVDPFLYYKELNIEPEEEVSEELNLRKETINTKDKLEKRIDEVKKENENLSFRINDLMFVTSELQKKLTLMSREPKFNVRGLCDNLKNDRSVINEISRQTTFVGIETKHIENNIIKFHENYGTKNINQLIETTDKMKKNLDSMKARFNTLRAVKEKRSITMTFESEMKNLRFQQQDILNIIDVTKMRISGVISKIGKQLRSISDFNIRVPTPPPFLNIQEDGA